MVHSVILVLLYVSEEGRGMNVQLGTQFGSHSSSENVGKKRATGLNPQFHMISVPYSP